MDEFKHMCSSVKYKAEQSKQANWKQEKGQQFFPDSHINYNPQPSYQIPVVLILDLKRNHQLTTLTDRTIT